jgi:hypothetical protein
MSKNEIVRIAGRALSIFCLIEALCEITYLPERFTALHHYAQRLSSALSAGMQDSSGIYYQNLDRISLAFLFMRIAGLMVFALLFWSCGPGVQRFLSAESARNDQLSQ